MADENVAAPNGFTPAYHLTGGEIRNNLRGRYSIPTTYGTAIYNGDPVTEVGTTNADGTIEINRAATAGIVCGVFRGCRYIGTDGVLRYSDHWVASTALKTDTVCEAIVCDDPQVVFEAQSDGTFAVTAIGDLIDYTVSDGNAATGKSNASMDTSTSGGTGTAWQIMGMVDRPGNEVGDYTWVHVWPKLHALRPLA